jgi:hypothetical protein
MLWTKRGINIDVLLLSLNYFDFARRLPVPMVDPGSGEA